jgi:spermidine/putrescine transport system substrate-binding protein
MAEELDITERGLSRSELLKLAAAAGGAALLGTRVGAAGAALSRLAAESGRLQVLDWVGYGYDGGQTMFTQYVKRYPQNKPQFTVMNNEADALGKITSHAVNPDLFRPYVGWVKYFAKSGLVQPWDTTQISNFKSLNPFMVKAGQYQGKQYGIPADWGFDAILYRTDKVHPKSDSFSLLFDDRYKGKITWYDDGVEMFTLVGYLMGFKDPYKQTDAQLKQAQDFLKSKRHLVRNIWSSEASMDTDFASGNVWIAYAWPADYWAMKGKGLKVRYMFPKEKPISWVGMFMLLKNTPRPHLAHAYVDAWSSVKSAKWLEDNYGYGSANTKARPSSSDLLKALKLGNPKAVAEPNAHLDRDVPRRDLYIKLWEQVKAS